MVALAANRWAGDLTDAPNPATQGERTLLPVNPDGSIAVDNGRLLVSAEYHRDGDDLVLVTDDGLLVVEDYFLQEPPPNLVSADGGIMTPNLVQSFLVVDPDGPFGAHLVLAQAGDPVGTVTNVVGAGRIIRFDGTEVEIEEGTQVYQDDQILTEGGGGVDITFIDETTFAVGENARLVVDEYVYDAETESGTSFFSILSGAFLFTSGQIGDDEPKNVEITTTVGTIGIRGTIIAGDINEAGAESNISIVDGAIVIETADGNVTELSDPLQSAAFTGNFAPVRTFTITGEQAEQLYADIQRVTPSRFDDVVSEASEEQQQQQQQQPGEDGANENDQGTDGNDDSGSDGESGSGDGQPADGNEEGGGETEEDAGEDTGEDTGETDTTDPDGEEIDIAAAGTGTDVDGGTGTDGVVGGVAGDLLGGTGTRRRTRGSDDDDELITRSETGTTGTETETEAETETKTEAEIEPVVLPEVRVSDAATDEGGGNIVFTVSLSEAVAQTVTVNAILASGSAQLGTDFSGPGAPQTLTFAPGQTEITVEVPVALDAQEEGTEDFALVLFGPEGAVIVDQLGTAEIGDAGQFSISNASAVEVDGGQSTTITFAVSLDRPLSHATAVQFQTQAASADGSDFVASQGTVVFQPGQTTAQIAVTVNGDDLSENAESFSVQLFNADGAVIDDAVGIGVIVDNETLIAGGDSYTTTEDTEGFEADAATGVLGNDVGRGPLQVVGFVDSDGNLIVVDHGGPEGVPEGGEEPEGEVEPGGIFFDTQFGGEIELFADGSFEYIPVEDFSGTDTATYVLGDQFGNLTTGTITFTVAGTPDPIAPIALDDVDPHGPVGGFVIKGDSAGDRLGSIVAAVGDVNGDGYADVIVGAPSDQADGAGSALVVFGGPANTDLDNGSFADSQGLLIRGVGAGANFGAVIGSAGDVNGDGIDDMLIASPTTSEVAVVYGGQDVGGAVDLGSLGGQGFTVSGLGGWQVGSGVAAVGDTDGDGNGDLLIGANDAGGAGQGQAFVVFGNGDATGVDLSTADGDQIGLEITGIDTDGGGMSIASAGDFNNDGVTDCLVEAGSTDTANGAGSGAAYVIFGQALEKTGVAGAPTVDVTSLAAGEGLAIIGEAAGDEAGFSVAEVGDVNGDGIDDILIGAVKGTSAGSDSGTAYVVFGSESPATEIDLGNLGDQGFRIIAKNGGDCVGYSVSSAGDINGDGLMDLLIGAPTADTGFADAGKTYVVFGTETAADVNLSDVAAGEGGFVIEGFSGNDMSGKAVSAAGDVNGDGYDDLIVGSPFGNEGGGSNSGAAYVVYGGPEFTIDTPNTENQPIAARDEYTATEDQALVVSNPLDGVLANDAVFDGDVSVVEGTFQTREGGTVEVSFDGTFTYTPAAEFSGHDTFEYTIVDETGDRATGIAVIDVQVVDDPPVVGPVTGTATEGVPTVFSFDVTDVDSETLTYKFGTIDGDGNFVEGGHPAAIVSVDDTLGTFTFDGDFGFDSLNDGEQGTFEVAYVADDGTSQSAPSTITITVDGVNDEPVAPADHKVYIPDIGGTYALNFSAPFDPDDDVQLRVIDITGTGIYQGAGGLPLSIGSIVGLAEFGQVQLIDFGLAPIGSQTTITFEAFDPATEATPSVARRFTVTSEVYDESSAVSIDGVAGRDVFYAAGQDDTVEGGNGNDLLIGDAGDERFFGDAGRDTLFGGDGNDDLFGGAGDDFLKGDAGDDDLDGDDGDDRLFGGLGEDTLEGGAGNDLLEGGEAYDRLRGGAGDDHLDGGAGDDSLHGDSGHDLLKGGAGEDYLEGGDDDDWLFGNLGRDTLDGEDGNDLLDGGEGRDELHGGQGDDILRGGLGEDTLAGCDGNDTLFVGEVAETGDLGDTLLGEDGDDTIVLDFLDFQEIGGGNGFDILRITGEAGQSPIDFSGLSSKIDGIQLFDLDETGDPDAAISITLDAAQVIEMSEDLGDVFDGKDVFEIEIVGTSNDTVNLNANFVRGSSFTVDGQTFTEYNDSTGSDVARVSIDDDIQVTGFSVV